MATIGIDCEIILDGTGYFVKPGTFKMKQPRVRKATIRADSGESYVNMGRTPTPSYHCAPLANITVL